MPTVASAGDLRHRIRLSRPVGTVSPTGGVVEGTPEIFADRVPARIVSALGDEAMRAGGLVAGATHLITIRYRPGVLALMTVTFESRVFQILSIIDVEERHMDLHLACVETL